MAEEAGIPYSPAGTNCPSLGPPGRSIRFAAPQPESKKIKNSPMQMLDAAHGARDSAVPVVQRVHVA